MTCRTGRSGATAEQNRERAQRSDRDRVECHKQGELTSTAVELYSTWTRSSAALAPGSAFPDPGSVGTIEVTRIKTKQVKAQLKYLRSFRGGVNMLAKQTFSAFPKPSLRLLPGEVNHEN